MKQNYIIGIDLGTTNCTLAYTEQNTETPTIHQYPIPQITSPGTISTDLSLPSFLYFPLQEELSAGHIKQEGIASSNCCVGLYARNRGAEMPIRLISSAKSWLCHPGIDRRGPLLPLDFEDEKMSPLKACAELLCHLRQSWEKEKPDVPFKDQQILVTVPASFDPSARHLIEEASIQAGYPPILLLEEPQSAFYAWLHKHQNDWRKILNIGDNILVVDIGGGTTDFSLISVVDQEGDLGLHRVAVGSHLLLGGDNIDLALAYLAKSKLEDQGHTLEDWHLQALTHACRQAKEQLFSEKPPKQADIILRGRGRKLIGNSLKTSITLKEAQDLILDGFMPIVNPEERSSIEKRLGLQQLGLPYAQDPCITRQLAKFLSMTGESESDSMDNFVIPSAVLFNGGTMKADAFRQRIIDQLNHWAAKLKKAPVKVLEDGDLDYAVSRGAAYYGLSCSGKAIRIRSGSSRSFFVGVEEAAPAVPGIQPSLKAVCVVPFGMEEGSELELPRQEFALVVGEPATFRFFSRTTKNLSNGTEPGIGTIVRNWRQELTELHSLETCLERQEGDGKVIRVKLKSRMTELGVLELWCVANDGRQWKLQFETRITN
jgi:molecular chaperone DnaK (HSP70)